MLKPEVAVWLQYFPSVPEAWQLQSGGLSGAEVWKVQAAGKGFALRKWPRPYPTGDRLDFLHEWLQRVAAHGIGELALPIHNHQGKTWTEQAGWLWEVTPWLPGASLESASSVQVRAALMFLARVHEASRRAYTLPATLPVGLVARLRQTAELQLGLHRGGRAERWLQGARQGDWPELESMVPTVVGDIVVAAPYVEQILKVATRFPVRSQVCLRDIWRDHLLFEGDQVTGLIDVGAAREDHVAADVTRLLGSLVQDDAEAWQHGLAAYQASETLTEQDLVLVAAYDESAVLLGTVNWLHWLYIDRREFGSRKLVAARFTELAGRLRRLAARTNPWAHGLPGGLPL